MTPEEIARINAGFADLEARIAAIKASGTPSSPTPAPAAAQVAPPPTPPAPPPKPKPKSYHFGWGPRPGSEKPTTPIVTRKQGRI